MQAALAAMAAHSVMLSAYSSLTLFAQIQIPNHRKHRSTNLFLLPHCKIFDKGFQISALKFISMEVSRQVPCFSVAGIDTRSSKSSFSSDVHFPGSNEFGLSLRTRRAMNSGYSDKGHEEYSEKETKKKLKLLKGLSELSPSSQISTPTLHSAFHGVSLKLPTKSQSQSMSLTTTAAPKPLTIVDATKKKPRSNL